MDLYSILGVSPESSFEEIKIAYKKKAKELHPDTGGSQEKFIELQTAFDILKDSSKRHLYDTEGVIDSFSKNQEICTIIHNIFSQELYNTPPDNILITSFFIKLNGKIREHLTSEKTNIKFLEERISALKVLKTRFKCKKKGVPNVFQDAIKAEIFRLTNEKKTLNHTIKLYEKTLEFIPENYTYIIETKKDALAVKNNY